MTFQQLNYLLEVNKTGSFSLAARNLYVSQSAVSNAIIALEKEVGTPLFVRGKKLLTPTARGEEVIEHAIHILERFNSITAPANKQKKTVRIGSLNYEPANQAFVRLLDENRGRKDIEFSFVDTRIGSFIEFLKSKELDIALFFNFTTYANKHMDEFTRYGLEFQKLTTIPAVISIGPGHRLYNQVNIEMQDFESELLLDTAKDGFANIGIMPVYLPINRNNVLVACGKDLRQKILMHGHAYSIEHMPHIDILKNSPMRYIPVEGLTYTVFAVTNPEQQVCPEVKRFLQILMEEIKKST